MNRRQRITFFSLLALGQLSLALTANGEPSVPSTNNTDADTLRRDSQPITVEGTLIPVKEVHIASHSKGVISFIGEEGDHVHLGDPILTMEDSQEKLEVSRQKKILELRTVEEKAEEELRSKNVDSPLEFAGKQLNRDLAVINVQQAEDLLSLRKVTAPFEGIITKRIRSVGEAADELSPVLTMVDVNNLYLVFHLPSSMRNRIRKGQTVSIQVDTPTPSEAEGKVQLCSPVIDPASGDFEVRVLIPNPDSHLTAGVQAKGIITTTPTPISPSPQTSPVTSVSP